MNRMFTIGGKPMKTWNVFSGCNWRCSYCWAKRLVETRLRDTSKYHVRGFAPTFHEGELNKTFPAGSWVFVAAMGDIYFCSLPDMERIIQRIKTMPEVKFLLQTKHPYWFQCELYKNLPDNVYLGTTLETDIDYPKITLATTPSLRAFDLAHANHSHKFVSIEPIMEFNLDKLMQLIRAINPEIVEVGADNYGNNLPEPEPSKVTALLESLRRFVPTVVEKQGLERLKEAK